MSQLDDASAAREPDSLDPCVDAQRGSTSLGRQVSQCCAVVGFDGSPASRRALAFAIGWAQRLHAQLQIVHVAEQCPPWFAGLSDLGALEVAARDQFAYLTGDIAIAMAGVQLPWRYHTMNGPVVRTLESHAAALSADVIFVGTSHRSPIGPRSSTASRLVNCARRVVIAVP
jgi:nucleotide-binding universal stress UspA family protein